MKDNARIAELLLRWQEADARGEPFTIEELCEGDQACEAILRENVRAIKSMEWIERQSVTTNADVQHSNRKRREYWHAEQEVVPGYRLIRPLGRGGFSEVWEAQGPRGIPVALKLVFADRSFPEEKALEILKTVRHPRIVSVFGAWSVANGFALAMEQADESVFDQWSKIQSDPSATIAFSQAALVAGAEALDFLNIEHHIQHRDVKPQNLLLFGDYIKIADFGIAKVVENHSTGHTGYFTVAYAPPEFFRGRSAAQSDQYSLAVMYTMLRSGKLPFSGNSAAMTHGHLHRAPDLTGLPQDERGPVARALAKDPKDRWPSCQAFADAVLNKKRVFLLPKTRRQVLVAAAVAGAAAIPALAWYFEKPKPLKLSAKFDMPPGDLDKLNLRQVAGATEAVRTPQGQLLRYEYYVLANGMNGAYIWNGKTGEYKRMLTPDSGVSVAIPNNEKARCMTGHNDGKIYAWKLDTGVKRFTYPGHAINQHVTSIDYSNDTYRCVTASTDCTIKIWENAAPGSDTNIVTGKLLRLIDAKAFVMCAKFLPNGSKIASVGHDGQLHLWDALTGQLLNKVEASSTQIWALDLSSNGSFALTGDANGIVKLWDLNKLTMQKEFEGHEAKVECVSFTANKSLICSGSTDRTLRFWNTSNGREMYRATHDSDVYGVSPANIRMNGPYHLTATEETVYAWEPIS